MRQVFHRLTGLLPVAMIKRASRLQFSHPAVKRVVDWGSGFLKHRDMVIAHGVGRGMRFNACGSNLGYALGTTEPQMQAVLEKYLKPGDTFYDVGACVGFLSIVAARLVGPEGHVVAFEPLPRNVEAIEHNRKLNALGNLKIFGKALSNENAVLELLVSKDPTGSKLASTGVAPDTEGVIQVETVALDDFLGPEGLSPPTVVKIDVEGAELDVIAGMKEILTRYRPVIICEMHGRNAEYARLITELGYRVATLEGDPDVAGAHWNVHTVAVPAGA
jgi:FkbM family methyltransferase